MDLYDFPANKTRLNQAEKLVQRIVNERRKMSIDQIAVFFFGEANQDTIARARVITSTARKLAADQFFIISNAYDTKGVYQLETDMGKVYKQAETSSKRGFNGTRRAKLSQAVLKMNQDDPRTQEWSHKIQNNLVKVIEQAAMDYLAMVDSFQLTEDAQE